MLWLLTAVPVLGLLIIAVADTREVSAVRARERAERLKQRFSDLRHRLIVYAGSGRMGHRERAGFEFLYSATTFMLRHAAHYPAVSSMYCVALLDDAPRQKPPRLRKKDLSPVTRKLLQEYVATTDELVNSFALPEFQFVAYVEGSSVIESMRRIRERRHQLKQEKQQVIQWRDAGRRVLNQTPLSLAR